MSSATIRYKYDAPSKLAAIVLYFQKDGQPDDTLVIRPIEGDTSFTAVFTQNTIGTRAERPLSHSELFPYLERFLEALPYDEQRCNFVQIDVPGYSSVMLKSTDVHYYMDTFYSQVRSLHNSWPLEVSGQRIQPAQTQTPAQMQTQTQTQTQTAPSAFTWYGYSLPTVAQNTPVTHPKRSASPRVTRSMAQQRTA